MFEPSPNWLVDNLEGTAADQADPFRCAWNSVTVGKLVARIRLEQEMVKKYKDDNARLLKEVERLKKDLEAKGFSYTVNVAGIPEYRETLEELEAKVKQFEKDRETYAAEFHRLRVRAFQANLEAEQLRYNRDADTGGLFVLDSIDMERDEHSYPYPKIHFKATNRHFEFKFSGCGTAIIKRKEAA